MDCYTLVTRHRVRKSLTRGQAHACRCRFHTKRGLRRTAAAGGIPLEAGAPRSFTASDGAGPRGVFAAVGAGPIAVAGPYSVRRGGVANDAAGAGGSRARPRPGETRRRPVEGLTL